MWVASYFFVAFVVMGYFQYKWNDPGLAFIGGMVWPIWIPIAIGIWLGEKFK